MQLLELVGRGLAHYLSKPGKDEGRGTTCEPGQLRAALRKGDVLLVEGFTRFSTAIKYTWPKARGNNLKLPQRVAFGTGRNLVDG